MNQPVPPPADQQPRTGRFVAFLNREKQPGDTRPMFVDGKIAKPDSTDELPVVLWAFQYTDKHTGEVLTGFNGTIGNVNTAAPAMDQIEALLAARPPGADIEAAGLTLKPNQILAFVNKPKPDGKAKQKTHYAFVNFGDGTTLVDLSLWLDKDRYGRAMLSGNTQWPLTPEQKAALKGTPETAPSLAKFEPNPTAETKKRTGRSGGRGE